MAKLYIVATIGLFVLFLSSTFTFAHPDPIWHSGQLTFWNKTTLQGDLSYNWSAEMILLRQTDGRVRTFSANQINRFGWFDYALHKQRVFISVSDAGDKNKDRQAFFELCMDGPLAVVRRLRRPHGLFRRTFSNPAYYADQPELAKSHEHFDYFVYDAGRLRAFDHYYLDIYDPLMMSYDRELKQYVMTHNINDRTILGRLVIIDHFNHLVQQDPKTASAKSMSNVQE
ncbi:hypothetical protein WBJ53_03150 [Spirosoma sp. SC4-14]|uniref:hypothetical protein n=1 Tax=Spirosoma sp. SC4-14 TaxID=3128900 RepID=UPI0030D24868